MANRSESEIETELEWVSGQIREIDQKIITKQQINIGAESLSRHTLVQRAIKLAERQTELFKELADAISTKIKLNLK